VSQECLEKLEDKDHPEPQDYQVQKELMDQEVPLETEVHPVDKECLDLKVQKVQLVLMDLQDQLDHLDQMELLEIEEFQDFQVQLDQWDQEELKVPKEKEEMLVLPVKKDQLDLLVFKDPQDQLEQEVKEERKVLLVNRELLVLVEDQVTKDLLEPQEQWVHLDPQVYLDLPGKLDQLDQQENAVNVVLLVPLVLLDHLGQLVNLDHLGYKEYLENKDLEVQKDPRDIVVSLVFRVFQGLSAQEERRVLQVKMERTEILEPLELVDHLVSMVPWDKWVIPVPLVQEVLREKKENVVHQVNLDQWDPLDLLEKDLALTWQLYPP